MELSAPTGNDPEKAVSAEGSSAQPEPLVKRATTSFKERARRLTLRKTAPRPAFPRRRDILSRNSHKIVLNEDEIFKPTTHHKEYVLGVTTLKGLAKFDDCLAYGISEEKEQDLLKKEIRNLIKHAKSDGPILFDSSGALGATDLKGFESVANLADQIYCNLSVIKHDNSRHVVEHCPSAVMESIQEFKRSRRHLISRYRQKKSHVEGRQPKVLDDPMKNRIAYFALVDYVLGVMAWWLVRTAESKYWKTEIMAILAQWAVKLKVISYDPVTCAERSLSDGEELMRQMVADLDSREAMILRVRIAGDSGDSVERKSFDALDAEVDLSSMYFQEKRLLRNHLQAMLYWTLSNLFSSERTGNNADSFEACTLVYKTGLHETLTVLSGDRSGDMAASSDLAHLSHIYTAFELLFRNTKALADNARKPRNNTTPDLCVKWRQSKTMDEAELQINELHVSTMDQALSLLVPLALTNPQQAYRIENLIQIASIAADEEDPILQFMPPWKNFGVEYTLSTSEWLNRQHRAERFHDPDVRPLSGSPLRRGIRAGSEVARLMSFSSDDGASAATQTRASEIIEEYEANRKVMESWTFAQKSITVNCRIYTRFFLVLAIASVCGSLAIPFSVGDRITGVDPFQITTFCWLVAGFILVSAKSRYVNEWPWHDFFRGQVVCRSVRDVRDVTGMNAQMILMYLLHNERKIMLTTRGPHNGMFQRAATEEDGFSIDEPVHLSTMLASGFVVLKVLNEKGEHLIFIDVRKGAEMDVALKNETGKHLACLDIAKEGLGFEDMEEEHEEHSGDRVLRQRKGATSSNANSALGAEKVLKLERVELRFNKMLGLYVKDSRFG